MPLDASAYADAKMPLRDAIAFHFDTYAALHYAADAAAAFTLLPCRAIVSLMKACFRL